jgi:hypothetical protein
MTRLFCLRDTRFGRELKMRISDSNMSSLTYGKGKTDSYEFQRACAIRLIKHDWKYYFVAYTKFNCFDEVLYLSLKNNKIRETFVRKWRLRNMRDEFG